MRSTTPYKTYMIHVLSLLLLVVFCYWYSLMTNETSPCHLKNHPYFCVEALLRRRWRQRILFK